MKPVFVKTSNYRRFTTALSRLDDRLRPLRVLHKAGAGPPLLHPAIRAAQIDIHAVEPQRPNPLRAGEKIVRFRPEDLRHNRPLLLRVP